MAAARGLQDSDVDPANEDANIVSKHLLGSGAVGTVYELTRSDGVQVVFKGETESRTGLSALSAGTAKNYDTQQMAVNLNFASKKAAVALGMGGLIVDYSAGSHKGVFGFYMEKAKGVTPGLLQREIPSSSSETGMSAIDIRCLPVNEQLKILADIKRELNRLHWLDLVIAHAERLKEEGNIVEGEAWQHVREKPLQTGNVTVQNRNGRNKQLGGDIAKTVNELSCPSYFAFCVCAGMLRHAAEMALQARHGPLPPDVQAGEAR